MRVPEVQYRTGRVRRSYATTFKGGLCAVLLGGTLAGCDSLPKNAPLASAVENESQDPQSFPFRLIKLDPINSQILATSENLRFSTDGFFRDAGSNGPKLGPGDVLSITVLEPASGGLFSGINSADTGGQGAKIVTLPDTQVDKAGMINFPFAGTLRAAGQTPRELGAKIEKELSSKVIQPQVIVRLSSNLSNKVVIGGAVKVPGEFDVTAAGETLLQMVARAGGPSTLPSDAVVRLTRRRETRSVRLQALIDNPLADIHMQAGDFVNVLNVPRTYTVLGAVNTLSLAGRVSDFPLPAERLSLVGALGRAGGLDDNRTDLKGVFILRYERRELADRMSTPRPGSSAFVPIVYQIDMSKAGGFFLGERFALRERDVVVLSDAPVVEVDKFLNLFRLASSPVLSATNSAQSF